MAKKKPFALGEKIFGKKFIMAGGGILTVIAVVVAFLIFAGPRPLHDNAGPSDNVGPPPPSDNENLPNQPPVASFSFWPPVVSTNDVVQFTDTSIDSDGFVVSWSWDFGDGASSTERNPTHQYAVSGNYTVTLTVTDDSGATDDFPQVISMESSVWTLVWSDEFNGSSVDTSNWVFETGGGGWGNNELEYYTNGANASVDNGILTITAKKESMGGRSYTSARMKTQGRYEFQYGKIEARIAVPMGDGLWPAFWMLGSNIGSVGWPKCGEIDIMEHINTETKIYGTMHWDSNGHKSSGNSINNSSPELYHTYTIEWDSSAIRWYQDGVQYNEANIRNNVNGTEEFHKPFFIILNLAVGGNWPGSPSASTTFPATYKIDYVRVFKPYFTVSVSPVSATVLPGGSVQANVQVSVQDTYSQIVSLSASGQPSGVTVDLSPSSGTHSFSSTMTVNVGATVTEGTYEITITGTGSDNKVQTCTYSLTVTTLSNLALNKTAYSSSNESSTLLPSLACDGNMSTRWSSAFSDPQWIYIDLGTSYNLGQVILRWETAYGKSYQVQVSDDASNWATVFSTTSGDGGTDNITFATTSARYVRMYGTQRGTQWGYSLWEFEIY